MRTGRDEASYSRGMEIASGIPDSAVFEDMGLGGLGEFAGVGLEEVEEVDEVDEIEKVDDVGWGSRLVDEYERKEAFGMRESQMSADIFLFEEAGVRMDNHDSNSYPNPNPDWRRGRSLVLPLVLGKRRHELNLDKRYLEAEALSLELTPTLTLILTLTLIGGEKPAYHSGHPLDTGGTSCDRALS